MSIAAVSEAMIPRERERGWPPSFQPTSLSPSVNPLDDPLHVFLDIARFLALQLDDGFGRVGRACVVGDYAHDLGLVVLLDLFQRVSSVLGPCENGAGARVLSSVRPISCGETKAYDGDLSTYLFSNLCQSTL